MYMYKLPCLLLQT